MDLFNIVFGSKWTYLILAGFFLLVLGAMIVYWLLKSFLRASVLSDRASAIQPLPSDDLFCKRVLSVNGPHKTILLAGAGLDCLPVTVPIRLALNLAKQERRCLLVDLDTRRDAVARAFGLEPETEGGKAQPVTAGLDRIDILPAGVFGDAEQCENLKGLLKEYRQAYAVILINAPCMDWHPQQAGIAGGAEWAFLFVQNESQLKRLSQVCAEQKTKVLGGYRRQEAAAASAAV